MKAANDNKRLSALPHSLQPRGLSRETAAEYIDVSPSLFDQMVEDGRMPRPKRINSRKVWDRLSIDKAFSALPGGEDGGKDDPWAAYG